MLRQRAEAEEGERVGQRQRGENDRRKSRRKGTNDENRLGV